MQIKVAGKLGCQGALRAMRLVYLRLDHTRTTQVFAQGLVSVCRLTEAPLEWE